MRNDVTMWDTSAVFTESVRVKTICRIECLVFVWIEYYITYEYITKASSLLNLHISLYGLKETCMCNANKMLSQCL